MQALEMPSFTVREAARYLGVENEKVLYAWAKNGRIAFTVDVTGQFRVPYGELWRLLREREDL